MVGGGVTQFYSLFGEEFLPKETQENNIFVTYNSGGQAM
jgi:hypothetical protein